MSWPTHSRTSTIILGLLSHLLPAFAGTVTVVVRPYLSNDTDWLRPQIHLYELGSHRDLWPTGHVQTADAIPPGLYEIDVFQPGFKRFHRELDVTAGLTEVRVVLQVSVEASGQQMEIAGRVRGPNDYAGIWVLAFPLAGSPADVVETRVGNSGGFRVVTSRSGPYLLTVVRGDRVLGTQPVVIRPGNSELTIEVAGSD
jgi:hypothetical protein